MAEDDVDAEDELADDPEDEEEEDDEDEDSDALDHTDDDIELLNGDEPDRVEPEFENAPEGFEETGNDEFFDGTDGAQ